MLRGGAIQRGCQLGDRRVVNALVRPLLSRRRHLTRAELSDNLFPDLGMFRGVLQTDAVKVQSPLLHFAVVASDAIVVYDRSYCRASPKRWTRGRLFCPDGMTSHEQNRHPAEPTNSLANHVRTNPTVGNLYLHSSLDHVCPGGPGQEESRT